MFRLPTQHQAINILKTLVIGGGEWLKSRPGRFTLGEKTLGIHLITEKSGALAGI
jgi:hypothetical protein